mgnify:CR=1 FL=1
MRTTFAARGSLCGDGTTGNYLFVNDYTTDPKTARFDSDADWIRFYASVQGDFLKIATGSEIASYPISQAPPT